MADRKGRVLVYGSYGYTGQLIVEEAVAKGLSPILGGRDAAKVKAQATALKLEARAFSLDDRSAVAGQLKDVEVVIHCAGPFAHTAQSMAGGCLEAGAHYLDITGEIEVFERMASLDAKAKTSGVMVMPGVGFDVVPSDCLAAHLHSRLPSASHLTLAFLGLGELSRGTLTTMVENIGRGGAVRKNGKITPVPAAWKTREIDFGQGLLRKTVSIPWGDVSTAFYTTGIGNIEVYSAFPAAMQWFMRLSRPFAGLLGSNSVQSFLKHQVRRRPSGPTREKREKGLSLLWGEVTDGQTGKRVISRLRTPEGYSLTALTAVNIAKKVLAGGARAGFQTPAMAFGKDLILEIPGTERSDE